MKTYIALFKGINVGGHKKVTMAELRELLSSKGFFNVKTYIQSGNVFFKSSVRNIQDLEKKIQKLVMDHFGFEVSVLVKTPENLLQIFANCPFPEEQKKASYFIMLHDSPDMNLVKEASEKIYEFDEYIIKNDCIYLFCEKGMGKSKFNPKYFERKLNTFATARNYNTMLKLLSLSSDS